MTTKKQLPIGVVGLGMGQHHAWASLREPSVKLAAIAEPDEKRFNEFKSLTAKTLGKKIAEKLDKIPRFDDYKTMAKSGEVEAISIALPTDMHYEATRFCLQHGLHVICEKPPTTNAAQMVKLARIVYEKGLTYSFVRQQRFTPKMMACREMALKGTLGRVYHAESHWLRCRGIPFRGGWGVNKDTGGGVLLDLGIHQIDDAWFCMGNPVPEAVFGGMHCAFDYLAKGKKLSHPYNADDLSVGMVRFADGATLSLSTSFAMNRVHPEMLKKTIVPGSDWQELHVLGSHAGVDVYRGKMVANHPKGVSIKELPMSKKIANMTCGFEGLIADFAKAALTGEEPLNSARQAIQLMYMLEAIGKSAETGKAVPVKIVNL